MSKLPPFRLPRDDEHSLIVGRNGSGKTHAGWWQMSLRSYNIMPWIAVDIKRDDLIAETECYEISVRDKIPRHPGLYVVRPSPNEIDALDDMFMRIWEAERCGTYVDEGYAIGSRNRGYRTLLMQGRSKTCPTITLSQRPLYLDRYAVSEQSHYQVFSLNDKRDWQVLEEFSPIKRDPHYGKHRHNSLWYSVKDDALYRLNPAPDRATILDTFERRIPRRTEKWV